MPIEIRELVFITSIAPDNPNGAKAAPNVQSENSASNPEQVINSCVEKVMEILKAKMER
jgi:hypothetical protein